VVGDCMPPKYELGAMPVGEAMAGYDVGERADCC